MEKIKLNNDDFILDEIESIELIGEEDTIDITVDETHMFFANDIYTHNSSISADVVTTDQMGGSIKKAQVGHVIISIAKSLEQKDQKLATIAITKSRIGSDGVVFANCKFDNEMLIIDTEESKTLLGHEKEVEEINEMNAKKRLGELQSNKKRTTIN